MIESIDDVNVSVEPFQPDYVRLDERSVRDLMQLFLGYAKQIPFVNEDGATLGKWDEMYSQQTLFLWLDISSLDTITLNNRKKNILEFWDSDGESKAVNLIIEILEILKQLFDKAVLVDGIWVLEEIRSVIAGDLFFNILSLKGLLKECTPEQLKSLEIWIEWLQNTKATFDLNYLASAPQDTKKNLFRDIVNEGINCLFILKKKSKGEDFNNMLKNGKHPAHIGLLFGFLKSYQTIQQQVNKIPKRHLDYYFRTILNQKQLNAEPDYAYLFIDLVLGVHTATIESGSLFSAGQDETGEEIIFKNEKSIPLTGANITALKTLLFHKNKSVLPLQYANMVTGVYMDNIPLETIKKEQVISNAWPLFGGPQSYKSNKELPEVGWAVASPIFNLNSGERTVKLSYKLESESIQACDSILEKLVTQGNDIDLVSKEEMLFRFIDNAFNMEITTANGWLAIEAYSSNFTNAFSNENCCLEFSFVLSENFPSWVNYSEAIHQRKFDSNLPLLSIKLKQDSAYYPFSLLEQLTVKTLDIDVAVANFNDFIVYNKHGLVDASNPFPLLGINPLQGNRFYIGANEWLNKKMSHLKLKIEWADLPKPNFKTYYNNYKTETITDQSFKIELTNYATNKTTENLFAVDNGVLKNETHFPEKYIDKPASNKLNSNSEFLNPNTFPLAFIGFELVAPNIGFGSSIYQEEMTLYGQSAIKNRKKQDTQFPPKPPYVPLVRKLSINYKANQSISFNSITSVKQTEAFDFFHMHPFGNIKEAHEKKIRNNNLLTNAYQDKGYLFIGLENLQPFTEISIFFKLIPSQKKLSNDNMVSISYLSGESWSDFGENVVENTTIETQETGIIRLFLPLDIESNHPLFDKDKDWIRLSVDSSNLKYIGRCVYINTNVGMVKRKLKSRDASFKILKPLSINKIITKNASVVSVTQPFYSFGGRQKEEETKFYSRVSNRLGHKNRMIRPRDYKRMILEKFPEVNWIKVLTPSVYGNSKGSDRTNPGTVKLIVMPKINQESDKSSFYIHKNTQLAIKKYVEAHCAPELTIEVESPEYEEIEVRCRLERENINEYIPYVEIDEIIKRQISPWLYFDKTDYKKVETEFSVGNLVYAISKHPKVKDVPWCQVIRVSKDNRLSVMKDDYRYTYFDSSVDGDIVKPSNGKAILVPAKEFKIYQSQQDYAQFKKLSLSNMDLEQTYIITAKDNAQQKEAESYINSLEKEVLKAKTKKKQYYVLNLKEL
ncbi:hypothetical protein [Lacinutrix chionoecetis]